MKSYHILHISCNWILSLCIMFKVLPCCSMYQFLHSFLWSNNNPLFRDISFCFYIHHLMEGFPSDAGDARGASLIPGAGRSPGEGNGNPFQYSCLKNPRDRGAWWAAIHRVTKSRTWLSNTTTADGNLGCFGLLATMTNTSVNLWAQFFVWTCFHFVRLYVGQNYWIML